MRYNPDKSSSDRDNLAISNQDLYWNEGWNMELILIMDSNEDDQVSFMEMLQFRHVHMPTDPSCPS
jgi:hypothetical protein